MNGLTRDFAGSIVESSEGTKKVPSVVRYCVACVTTLWFGLVNFPLLITYNQTERSLKTDSEKINNFSPVIDKIQFKMGERSCGYPTKENPSTSENYVGSVF